jgi:hypothetical protein
VYGAGPDAACVVRLPATGCTERASRRRQWGWKQLAGVGGPESGEGIGRLPRRTRTGEPRLPATVEHSPAAFATAAAIAAPDLSAIVGAKGNHSGSAGVATQSIEGLRLRHHL